MMKNFAVLLLALASALPLTAQNWSVGAGTGPFVFGDFLERTVRIGTGEGPSAETKLVLSAGTRAGAAFDIERRLNDRWAVRLEGTFTNAPLRLEQSGGNGDGAELDAGDLDVATFMLPIVYRINRSGAFRFHVMAGPAMAIYRGNAPDASSNPVFEDTQKEWGIALGGGVGWWLSDRFAIEGNLTDIATTSPFEDQEFPSNTTVHIPKPHNVHTTIGVRWVF
ncbi:MAG: outer membrane beta-barrel protein [Thermoanaerobaculia bacterium]